MNTGYSVIPRLSRIQQAVLGFQSHITLTAVGAFSILIFFSWLSVLERPCAARVEPGRTLLQTTDALKAACPEYSSFYGTSSEGLDDCAIR